MKQPIDVKTNTTSTNVKPVVAPTMDKKELDAKNDAKKTQETKIEAPKKDALNVNSKEAQAIVKVSNNATNKVILANKRNVWMILGVLLNVICLGFISFWYLWKFTDSDKLLHDATYWLWIGSMALTGLTALVVIMWLISNSVGSKGFSIFIVIFRLISKKGFIGWFAIVLAFLMMGLTGFIVFDLFDPIKKDADNLLDYGDWIGIGILIGVCGLLSFNIVYFSIKTIVNQKLIRKSTFNAVDELNGDLSSKMDVTKTVETPKVAPVKVEATKPETTKPKIVDLPKPEVIKADVAPKATEVKK